MVHTTRANDYIQILCHSAVDMTKRDDKKNSNRLDCINQYCDNIDYLIKEDSFVLKFEKLYFIPTG